MKFVGRDWKRAAQMLGASPRQVLWRVVLPGAMPHIFGGLRLGIAYAWTLMILAEMFAVSAGFGYVLWRGYEFMRMDIVLAGMFMLGIFGFVSDRVIVLIGRRGHAGRPAGREVAGRVRAARGFPRADLAVHGQRQPCRAVLLLRGIECGHRRYRLVQILADSQPARLRLHLRHRQAWGLFDYAPEKYASTQPFLALFFVFYLLIPLLLRVASRPVAATSSMAAWCSACRWWRSRCRRA